MASQAPMPYFKFRIVIRNTKKPGNCALKRNLNSTLKFGTYMQVHIIEASIQVGFVYLQMKKILTRVKDLQESR